MRISQKNNTILKAGGRPNKGGNSPKLYVVMPPEMLTSLEEYARSKGISRSEAARQMIQRGLDGK